MCKVNLRPAGAASGPYMVIHAPGMGLPAGRPAGSLSCAIPPGPAGREQQAVLTVAELPPGPNPHFGASLESMGRRPESRTPPASSHQPGQKAG